ncbi:MAG: cytochrome c oxidase subunit II [Gammaproteobacteria bacterium]|jgi:cytochrome c oxidase subunit 2
MIQTTALIITLAATLGLAAAYLFVVANASANEDFSAVKTRAYRLRTPLFWVLVAVIAPVTLYTLVDLPYTEAARQGSDAVNVEATGHQWYWQLSQDSVEAGQPVVFHVRSADVNHGFAVYDDKMNLVAQTQAMPGYTNKLAYTFKQPGTYQILCLEYCGLSHTRMRAEFHVTAAR